MAFSILLVLVTGSYALMIGTLAVVAHRAARRAAPSTLRDGDLPRVAVLVAARNEEHTLERCLDALLAQDYPADRLTVYVANDHSTDRTGALIERYRKRTARRLALAGDDLDDPFEDGRVGFPEVRPVEVAAPVGHLQGKANALHAAIGASDEDFLLVTDADCAPPPGWARRMVAHLLADAGRGAVAGQSLVEGEGLAPAVQALDWAYLLTTASALAALGRDATAMGNNMALRRTAYEAVGGYPALPFSVTEDYELWRAIRLHPDFSTHFPVDGGISNRTLPLRRLRDIYMQRRRWARGGMRAKPWLYGVYALTHLAHLLPLIGLALAPVPAVAMLGTKWAADAALLWVGLEQGDRRRRLWAFPVFEGVLHAYMATLPYVLLLFPRIEWKDRKL